MIYYYIGVTVLIIVSSILLEKYKRNWRYIPLIITILTFLSPPIYEAFKKEKPIPNFDARIYQYDIIQDSVFLKFEIENIGNVTASNIWHITSLNENQYGENLKSINKIEPKEKYTIFSFCRFNAEIKNWMKPVLYLGFNYEHKGKIKTVYKRFDFLITNTQNSGSYSKINSSDIKEIKSFETLLDSLGGINKRLSMNDGSIFMTFIPSDYYDNPLIAMSHDKRILYNPVDSHVYFERPYDEEIMLVISRKIDKNYKRDFHTFLVSWSDSTTFLSVDNQEIINDSIIRNQLATNPAIVHRDFGINWFNNGDYYNAISMLEKSLAIDEKNHFITYAKLFLCYESIGLIDKGIEILEKAIKVGHLDSSIVLNLAITYERINENKKASEIYTLDHKNSKSLTGFLNHINLHNRLENYWYAMKIIQNTKDIYPNSSQLCNNTGITCLGLGDSTLALLFFNNAIKLDSQNINAKRNYNLLENQLKNSR